MYQLASLDNARKKYLFNTVRVHGFYDIHYVIEYLLCTATRNDIVTSNITEDISGITNIYTFLILFLYHFSITYLIQNCGFQPRCTYEGHA